MSNPNGGNRGRTGRIIVTRRANEGGKLEGRVALITGGGGEIASAIAQAFAQEGASIIVGDVRGDAAQATAGRIRAEGGQAAAVTLDVSDPQSCSAAVDATIAQFGKLTTLVNVAAAVTPDGTVETLSIEDWNRALAVNLTGPFLMAKYAVPRMREAGGGSIINIASQLGQIGVPKRAPYSTTKAALIRLTTCLACDHADDGIRVNSLSPGAIDTARSLRRFGTREIANKVRGPLYLLRRTGTVEEIASGAVFLASDDSSFMTGADLLIDGGYLAFKGGMEQQRS
jgi:NAD(P)-dependent dehydrogenase (short-subunit alcohol dehydrogenase family)